MQAYFQVSRDAARALSTFSDAFRTALQLADVEQWAEANGFVDNDENSLKKTYPVPVSAAGYHEFKGDMKYRSLYERSLTMYMKKKWQDGVEELADVVEAPDFSDWPGEPARMALEGKRLPNQIVMTMLESGSGFGPLLDFYRDPDTNTASTRRLFAADHPFNVFEVAYGTFDNDQTTTAAEIRSGKFFDDLDEYARGIKGPNGKPMGLTIEGGVCLIPPRQVGLFRRALGLSTVIRNISSTGTIDAAASVVAGAVEENQWRGVLKYTVTNESSQPTVFYVRLNDGGRGLHPWIVALGKVEEIIHDKTSAKYKDTLKVAIAELLEANVAAALPHAIVKVTITG